jgi:hypothetical protein
MAILSWIIFTVAIGFIKPPPHSCWREMNATHQIIERVGYSTSTLTSTVKVIVKRQTFKLSTSSLKKTTEIINNLNRSMNSTVSSSSRRRKPLIKTTTLPQNFDQEDDDIESNEEDNPIKEINRITAKPNSQQQFDTINLSPIYKPQKTMGNPLSITHTNLSLVKPLASPILYEKKDVRNVFMVFVLLIIVGEFFSAPAITLAVSKNLSTDVV